MLTPPGFVPFQIASSPVGLEDPAHVAVLFGVVPNTTVVGLTDSVTEVMPELFETVTVTGFETP